MNLIWYHLVSATNSQLILLHVLPPLISPDYYFLFTFWPPPLISPSSPAPASSTPQFIFLWLTECTSRNIRFVANGKISPLWLSSITLCVFAPHLLHLVTCHGHLGCFRILAIIINNAAINMRVHLSFWITVFIFFR